MTQKLLNRFQCSDFIPIISWERNLTINNSFDRQKCNELFCNIILNINVLEVIWSLCFGGVEMQHQWYFHLAKAINKIPCSSLFSCYHLHFLLQIHNYNHNINFNLDFLKKNILVSCLLYFYLSTIYLNNLRILVEWLGLVPFQQWIIDQ